MFRPIKTPEKANKPAIPKAESSYVHLDANEMFLDLISLLQCEIKDAAKAALPGQLAQYGKTLQLITEAYSEYLK